MLWGGGLGGGGRRGIMESSFYFYDLVVCSCLTFLVCFVSLSITPTTPGFRDEIGEGVSLDLAGR